MARIFLSSDQISLLGFFWLVLAFIWTHIRAFFGPGFPLKLHCLDKVGKVLIKHGDFILPDKNLKNMLRFAELEKSSDQNSVTNCPLLTSAGISDSCFESRFIDDLARGFSTYGGKTGSVSLITSCSSSTSGFSTAETLQAEDCFAFDMAYSLSLWACEVGVFLMKWLSKVFCGYLGGDFVPTLLEFAFAIFVLAAFPFLSAAAPARSVALASTDDVSLDGVLSLDSMSLTLKSRLRALAESPWESRGSTGLLAAGVTRPLDLGWWLKLVDVFGLSCITFDQLERWVLKFFVL